MNRERKLPFDPKAFLSKGRALQWMACVRHKKYISVIAHCEACDRN